MVRFSRGLLTAPRGLPAPRGKASHVTALVPHSPNCMRKGRGHSDAAKRVSDTYRLHKTAQGAAALGRFIAVALADGTSDGVLYDTKTDAVRHQHHNEMWFAYVCIGPHDMAPCEAEEFLATVRLFYDAGIPMQDPREVIARSTVEDQRSLVRSIAARGRVRPRNLVYPGE